MRKANDFPTHIRTSYFTMLELACRVSHVVYTGIPIRVTGVIPHHEIRWEDVNTYLPLD